MAGGCIGEAVGERHALMHSLQFISNFEASKCDQPLLRCFVRCVKLGVLEAEKECETELVVEFFLNLAYLYLHLNHSYFYFYTPKFRRP